MKLLIVDDESPARDRLRRLADDIEDCRVVAEACNGQEALEMCSTLAPDVVLLDIRMPGLSGLEIARHLDTLETPPADIVLSCLHMFANRLLRSSARAQEMVLYDFLARLYASEVARRSVQEARERVS